MNCTDWKDKLPDLVDGMLAPAVARALETHLAACPACRAELESLRALRAATKNLARELAPSRDLWPEIEKEISAPKIERVFFSSPLLWKLAAALALLASTVAVWKWAAPPAPAWSIASISGAPRIDEKNFTGESHLRVGQWLETDAASRVKVSVGNIGEVSLAPNSRVRLAAASPTDHRLELARGSLSALIWAPPRLFFVDTPSATAVDLGCAYTLDVADNGDGLLRVTAGYVALQDGGRETIIARNQMCATRRGLGPGTPFAADAPVALREALKRFDFEKNSSALADILAAARADDSVTLWNLLARTAEADRGAVFDTLARDHAPPPGVTRAGIVAGDGAMLTRWGDDLGLTNFFATK